jgi:plasmid stabilization system protein ParE
MQISLMPEWEQYVHELVDKGDFATPADRLVERLAEAFERLARNPWMGQSRDELIPG